MCHLVRRKRFWPSDMLSTLFGSTHTRRGAFTDEIAFESASEAMM